MRSGITKLLILKLLHEGPKSGYDIVKKIESITQGLWKPSPGGIYPILASLEEHGLIRSEETHGKRIYHITEKGKEKFKEYKEVEREIREKISALIRVLANIMEEEEIKEIAYILVPENVPKKYKKIVKVEKEVLQIIAKRVRTLLESERKDLAIELLKEILKKSEEYLKKAGIDVLKKTSVEEIIESQTIVD